YPGIAAAAEAAAIDDALVMVVFTAEWCGQCQLLKSRTLADPKFAESTGRLNIVHIDIDTDADTARQYKVNAIPDVVLMTADLKIIARQRGYVDTATMIQWVLDGYKRAAAGEWEGTELPAELTRGPRSRR